jgi:CheY-like chemotaxis protein/HPt (histidine-containing phosphotransfer) domain-containing protein
MAKRPANSTGTTRPRAQCAAPTGRANTLGLSSQQLDVIYDQLDAPGADSNHRRQSSRLAFRQPSIGVEINQPGGGQTHIHVACRNLSRTGLGFLHSSYVHVGTRIILTLAHQTTAPVRIHAKVMRCRHVTRNVHDVGVMFDEPINVRDYMEMDPLNQTFTCEMVEPAQLKGSLLIVAEYKIEQACVRSMLGETSLDFWIAASIQAGLEQARKGVSLILCDDAFEQGSGDDLILAARKAGVRAPIILMSADTSEQGLARIRRAKADAFLAKPLQKDLLLRAIAEFLLMNGDKSESSNPFFSTLAADSPMRELANSFVEDLSSIAEQVEKLGTAQDITGIRRQALRIGGPASSLGFVPIATLAQKLVASLDMNKSFEQSVAALNSFVAACRGARKSSAPVPAPAKPEEAEPGHTAPGHATPADAKPAASKPGETPHAAAA